MSERYARVARLLWYLFWAANIALLAHVWSGNRLEIVEAGGGAALIAIGALCGLIGAFCLLSQMVMISGVRPLERPFGLDRLARIHHTNGLVGYLFIMTHVSLIILGYSTLTSESLWATYFELRGGLPYIVLASYALLALNAVVLSSIVIVRSRLRYEWWRTIHFLVYLTLSLAFFHQVANGQELLGSRALRTYWLVLYATAFGSVIYMRWVRPLLLHWLFKFRIKRVVHEANGVTSIYVNGKGLKDFRYEAGQFNFWYFWWPGLRLQKHPFTISSSPGDKFLRLTPKAIGDYTAKLPDLKPGTPVLLNGPFGRFTMAVGSGRPRLFIAGGIGITPIRSMLGEQVRDGDVLLYSARTKADLAFKRDFDAYKKRGLSVHYILSDDKVRGKNMHTGLLDRQLLGALVPDAASQDVWLCGPPGMMDAVSGQLRELGVPRRHIYTERFRL